MRIRNKETGVVYEIAEGAIYPEASYEIVNDAEIKVGEPKVEFVIEQPKPEPKAEPAKTIETPKKPVIKTKNTTKRSKKNETKKDK